MNLWEKTTWVNPSIIYIFNSTIYEYDIKSAGLSITKFFKLLDEETIASIEALPKEKRVKKEGMIQRDNKEYRDALNNGFKEIRKLFIESNGLTDDDIVSIKKDAIFVRKKVQFTKFECVKFVEKNFYTSYINTHGIEYYYSQDALDIKGISDEKINLHLDGILNFIIKYFDKMENQGKRDVLKYCKLMYSKYKKHELPVEYYREFNNNSKYNVPDNDIQMWDDWWDERKDELYIMHNIESIFIPFTKIAV